MIRHNFIASIARYNTRGSISSIKSRAHFRELPSNHNYVVHRQFSSRNPYGPLQDDLVTTFESNVTKDLTWRKATLQSMLKMFTEKDNAQKWVDARISDLGGGEVIALKEIQSATYEILHCLENLEEWAADRPADLGNPLAEVEGLDRRLVRPTPKGVTLTIGAWNFPINTLYVPVIDSIAAGNCCFMKPSELAPAISQLAEDMAASYLPSDAVKVVQGGIPETSDILALKFDHMTVTGSSFVGQIVMKAASEHLTPCTLELGGKNPTFVDKSADIQLAVDRMVLAKTYNAGQLCVDLDYVLVDETISDEFMGAVISTVKRLLGNEEEQMGEGIPHSQKWFNSIVNERNVMRLKSYLEEDHGGKVILGGLKHVDAKKKFFPLTVVVNPKMGSKLMTEEIFGPIIVIKTVPNVEEAVATMKEVCDTPLALYVYSNDDAYTEKVLLSCTSGSVGVNTTFVQMFAHTVPFGGVGTSGMGAYHGKWGFDEYSHMRSIYYRSNEHSKVYAPPERQPGGNKVTKEYRDDMASILKAQGETLE